MAFLPGQAGPQQFLPRQDAPLTAYETAAHSLGPDAEWRLQDPDPDVQIDWLNDQFTDTNGTLLSAHTADSGHSWTLHPSYAQTSAIQSNRVAAVAANDSVYYSSDVPSSANYSVEARLRCITNTFTGVGVRARQDTSANTCYRVYYLGLANQWILERTVSGTGTSLGVFNETLATNDERVVVLKVDGPEISAFIDGVLRIQNYDTQITAAGRPAVQANGTSTTGFHLDQVQAYKSAPLIDASTNNHPGTAKGNFLLGQDGALVGEGALATENLPQPGAYAQMPGYRPFVVSSSRTFVGMARIDATTSTGGPIVFFGSRGGVDGTTQPVCVLEAVYENADAGYTRVHWVSNVEVMSFLAQQWFGVLPKSQWFHYALTVTDAATQTLELFINGISRGAGVGTNQPNFSANAGDYMLGMRGQSTSEFTPLHAMDGAHGMQAVYTSILTPTQIHDLAQKALANTAFVPLSPTVTTTATVTPLKKAVQALTATATTTASIVRQVGKVLVPVVTTTASIVKSVGKRLNATATTVASITAIRVVLLALTATVTTTASIVKRVGKNVTATAATTTASIVKQVGKVLSATSTTVATLTAIKVILKTLSATVTTTASIVKRVNKTLSFALSSTATMVRQVGKRLTVTVTTTATMTAIRVFLRTLSATVTTTASMTRRVGKTVAGAVSTTATLTKRVAVTLATAVVSTIATIAAFIPLPPIDRWLGSGDTHWEEDQESRWPVGVGDRWDGDNDSRWNEDNPERW